MIKGSCLCGAVEYEIHQELEATDACHCNWCRKQTGHFLVSTDVKKSAFTLHNPEKVSWYYSSEKARRGFCSICGSTLFWEALHKDLIAVAMGTIDGPTKTKIDKHIHVASKGDYYELNDGIPQHQ